jgi:hypothetical protein
MKYYDYERATALIEENKENLQCAYLGMSQDWSWTADEVWSNGEYTKILKNDTLIGGINGSSWATPSLKLIYKDGEEDMVPCFKGESEPEDETIFQRQFTEITKNLLK